MKKENKEIYKRVKLEEQKKLHPNECFCESPTYTDKDYIKETNKTYYSKFDYYKTNPFSLRVFKCQNCGKEYTEQMIEA
jgi:hypothetical protein